MDCKDFKKELPDLVLTPGAVPSVGAVAHLRTCPPCTEEYVSFQETFGMLDGWKPVEPTPYFDTRVNARVREEQAKPAMSWFERLQTRLALNTGRHFRTVLAGAFSLALVLGGGGIAGINYHNQGAPVEASATVNDLQILDRNAQALQQIDELQMDDDAPQGNDAAQPVAGPTT